MVGLGDLEGLCLHLCKYIYICTYILKIRLCFVGRSCADDNPWVKLVTVMLQRYPPEEKDSMGNEILKICRSLYGTKYKLSVEVSFNAKYPGYESCFEVPSTRMMLPYWIKSSRELVT